MAASSLYTHLLPAETRNYLRETARVLRSGGRCLVTFFVVDPEAERLMANDLSSIAFRPYEGCRVRDVQVPAAAVAYDDHVVTEMFAEVGLRIDDVRHGVWCGRLVGTSYQDLVLAVRP